MKRIVLLALLLVLLSGCAAKPTDVVYYVLGDGRYRTDGETTERVRSDTDEMPEIASDQIILEGHHGRAWADNGTIWIEHSTTEMATACIQQWDPQTGTLLAELPRYHDGYYIVHMEVHDGMLFFIDRCELWVRLPDGTLHELMELPEGPLYDYENFPPAMYYGETAMVVVIDDSATYIAYPQNKS